MEIGTPLNECLGERITVASTGASVCGEILGACGFDVSHDAGAPSTSSSIADLIVASPAAKPLKPGL